ncbi:RDD family protein [Brevundimonas lenta]|uniref:Putative RDD family membrane protein YckC n=1 Tax=Brevundimonas lenta TaxID=424796 RepID=A0A7W6JEP0_9CAUL|nr:RDD family protein [Brevundimonas lenta]MBB4083736.1 putative RDD family membrane protein YckC [Brevundimonas lenta]
MATDIARGNPTERAFVTPEGVDLRLNIGDAGQRAAAFLLDASIIIGVLIALSLVLALTGVGAVGAAGKAGVEVIAVLWLAAFFFLRNFYFTAFELSAAAATPGKRMMGLRVAARDGGRLKAEAIFTRNAMRELEVFLPLSIMGARAAEGGVDAWIYVLSFAWAGIFVFFPLFNKDRLRVGDLVGGTWVVRTPRRKLTRDMADDGAGRRAIYDFTTAQLDAYGAKELHVLETILRDSDRKTLRDVAERISGKIGWTRDPHETDRAFLSAYYAALRERLEQKLLMGVRRRDKHDV